MSADETVVEILGQLLDQEPEELAMDTMLADLDGWDSVNQMRVLVYLERELGTSLDYDRFMKAASVADLSSVVGDAREKAV